MSEDYGANFITITDEDGNEFELEHLDTLEYKGETYMAFFPALPENDRPNDHPEEEYGLIILKVISENGQEELSTLDDEDELEDVYQQFMELLFEEEAD